jgi:DNA primase catalytic core
MARGGVLDALFDRADIVDIAQRLGLQVDRTRTTPRKAICPFHKDNEPSLNLYQVHGALGRSHYHCFACSAHGDIVDLVRGVQGVDFRGAVEWLCTEVGVPLPAATAIRVEPRVAIARMADLLRQQSRTLDAFAKKRGFTPSFLRQRGVGATSLRPLISEAEADKPFSEALIETGLASVATSPREANAQLFPNALLRGFYAGERIVFPIDNLQGDVVGYAARAAGDETPKYLFSRGFKRARTLYGAKRAVRAASEGAGIFELYVVEGILDALRLETVGLTAVAILGAQATAEQCEVLGSIIDSANKAQRSTRVMLFLDPDEAGRRGTVSAFASLANLQRLYGPFDICVIDPPQNDNQKLDPDTFLRGATSETRQALIGSGIPALEIVVANILGKTARALNLSTVSSLERATAARRIADTVDPYGLSIYLDTAYVDASSDDWGKFVAQVRRFISLRSGKTTTIPTVSSDTLDTSEAPTDDASVLRALELARSTAKRREYPIDEAAFERLEIAGSALYYVHAARLREGSGPSEPYPARHVPKDGARYRTKCGPVAEDIVQQQYLLSGLLRIDESVPEAAELIPAVRFKDGVRRLTGPTRSRIVEPLSFAYQIDQDIADGIAPPRREGLFRPYYKCWLDFIGFIDERMRHMPHEVVHILRLDISGYYDNLRLSSARDALFKPLKEACGSVKGGLLPLVFPGDDTSIRAERILDLILKHSFGYQYCDPVTGEINDSAADVGMPQGPDLSAYLANIALFELDAQIGEELQLLDEAARAKSGNSQSVSAVYARYVDDMVLVCGDGHTARHLQRKIAEHLARMGLRLNRKTEPPPPLTLPQARAWITDNRSGAGFSGPLDEVSERAFFDPLVDAGDINPDRKFALGLLYDPALERLDIYEPQSHGDPRKRAIAAIKTALSSSDLRHNDRVKAFGWLWRIASADAAHAGAIAVANRFVELVNESEPLSKHATEQVSTAKAMAALDAFEGCMRYEQNRDDATTPDTRRQLELRDKLAALDILLLTDEVIKQLFRSEVSVELMPPAAQTYLDRYDVTIQRATTLVAACSHAAESRPRASLQLEQLRKFSLSKRDWLGSVASSLRRYSKSIGHAPVRQTMARADRDSAAFLALHSDIAEWQRWAAGTTSEALDFVVEGSSGIDDDDIPSVVARIRSVWAQPPRANTHTTESLPVLRQDPATLSASITLLNITMQRAPDFFDSRPDVVVQLVASAGTALERPTPFLPRPPGLMAAEALLKSGNEIIHVGLAKHANGPSVWGLEFSAPILEASGTLVIRTAPLRDLTSLAESFGTSRSPYSDNPGDIAEAYRGFFAPMQSAFLDSREAILMPSANSFFFRSDAGGLFHHVITWTCPPAQADDFASVRRHGALTPWPIFRKGAPYWRFGWALCDVFEYAEDMHNHAESKESPNHDTADAPQEHPQQLARALVRDAFQRLTGPDGYGPGEPDREGIPSRISRSLILLEAFEQARGIQWTAYGRAQAATIQLANYADGVMVNERIERPGQPERPGGLAALIARAARRGARGAIQASVHWQGQDDPASLQSEGTGLRRIADAWISLGERIVRFASQNAETTLTTARPLVAGLRILGIGTSLRGLVHDLVRIGGDPLRAELVNLPIDIEALGALIGVDAALVEVADPAGGRRLAADYDLSEEVRDVLRLLDQDLSDSRGARGITPLGWAVLVAGLSQGVSISGGLIAGMRPALLRPEDPAFYAETMKQIFDLLAHKGKADSTQRQQIDPRESFSTYTDLPEELWTSGIRALQHLDTQLGIRVESLNLAHEPIRRLPSSNETYAVRIPGSDTRALPGWAVLRDTLKGRDQAAQVVVGGHVLFPTSISWHEDQPLSASVVSDQLAYSAFGKDRRSSIVEATQNIGSTPSGISIAPSVAEPDRPEPNATLDTGRKIEPAPLEAESDDIGPWSIDASDRPTLDEIKTLQLEAWNDRAIKSSPMHRLALLQWDVADSYSFPNQKNERLYGESSIKWSLEEMRRRAILQQVLEACRAFKVDGLVLPEYGVRPETVNWLFAQMRNNNFEYPKAIWPGSFRVPAGEGRSVGLSETGHRERSTNADEVFTRIADTSRATLSSGLGQQPFRSFSSVVPVLYRIPRVGAGHEIKDAAGPIGLHYRLKRHPAMASQEIFYPDPFNSWQPLGKAFWGHMHLLSFTAELVCAEMFLHASHANILTLKFEIEKLRARFDVRSSESIEADLRQELLDFAVATSYSERTPESYKGDQKFDALQRSILIIPAMTSRSADYHLFGQVQHLASGLVTVFANSSHPSSCGGSAFIGLDGWKGVDGKLTPYGEIGPGIFNFVKDEFGPLKERESALVIADINPLHSTDHKPRPQYQPRSLQLVAHLPLIFETQYCGDDRTHKKSVAEAAGRKSPPDHPDGRRVNRLTRLPFLPDTPLQPWDFEDAIRSFWAGAYNRRDERRDSKLVERFLRVLESFADDPHWLAARRRALLTTPISHPPGNPPAAIMDWIYVKDGWNQEIQKAFEAGPSSSGPWIDDSPPGDKGS